jgi:hypothetical protein
VPQANTSMRPWVVWGTKEGTHDLAPLGYVTRFATRERARARAKELVEAQPVMAFVSYRHTRVTHDGFLQDDHRTAAESQEDWDGFYREGYRR